MQMTPASNLAGDPVYTVDFEPRSAVILCFTEIPMAAVTAPFLEMAKASSEDGSAAFQVGLVAVARGQVRTADGELLTSDYALADPEVVLDDFLVLTGFLRSPDFADPMAVAALAGAVARARRVGIIAGTRQEARRAHVLLRSASTRASGAFWNAFRPRDGRLSTEYIQDGRLTWAIGPDAGRDFALRLAAAR